MPQLGQWYQELLTPEQLASYEEAKNRRNQELELQRMRTQEKVAELVKKGPLIVAVEDMLQGIQIAEPNLLPRLREQMTSNLQNIVSPHISALEDWVKKGADINFSLPIAGITTKGMIGIRVNSGISIEANGANGACFDYFLQNSASRQELQHILFLASLKVMYSARYR